MIRQLVIKFVDGYVIKIGNCFPEHTEMTMLAQISSYLPLNKEIKSIHFVR